MNEMIYAAIGAIFGAMTAAVVLYVHKRRLRARKIWRRGHALEILKKNGLSPQLYLPACGIDDQELAWAMNEYGSVGMLIVNDEGEVLGAFSPLVPDTEPPSGFLRLVVSND